MRVLIATVTAGGGHMAAAAALKAGWAMIRPGDIVELVDILQFSSSLNRRMHVEGYVKLAGHAPELWGLLFEKTDNPELSRALRRVRKLLPSRTRARFGQYIGEFDPDVVLCTHYMPLWTLAETKSRTAADPGRMGPFIVCVVTDFDAHALWLDPCVDLYCVAADETRARMLARGVPAQSIVVTGIPVAPAFAERLDTRTARRALGLQVNTPVVLVLSGGFGIGAVAETVAAVDSTPGRFQLLVVCGRNEKLRAQLAQRTFAHQTRVFGFVSNMHELMAAANLIVTKPGGLTTSEALAMHKPMLIVNPIPGQESANAAFLIGHGAAAMVEQIEDIPRKLSGLLGSPSLKRMARAAAQLGKPGAASAICREVVSRLGRGT